MNKTIFDTCTVPAKMNDDKIKEDYANHNRELDQKCFIAWSPLEENKYLFRQKYVSCSNSVPRRNKRFIRYKISRSLNFDTNIHSSSSENSSFEEDKHLSRSAKIMRALNFNSSPSYYGKMKIKKSLNFNLTPSPKRFMPSKKSIRKALSLNFNSPLSVSNKFLNFENNPNHSVNSSLLYSSSESIDENQNETPLQQNTKERGILHYSTPNTKLNKKSLRSTASSLRSQLKETIDNIICITATPNSQSTKHIKSRLDETTSTSRNLFYELYDNSSDRPSTPVNVINIIPESTSAIKRSHKKERFSRRTERDTKFLNSFSNDINIVESDSKSTLNRYAKQIDPLEESLDRYSSDIMDSKDTSLHNSGNQSDTGSIFDYAEEEKTAFKYLVEATSPDNVLSEVQKFDVDEVKLEGNTEDSLEIERINENELPQEHNDIRKDDLSDQNLDIKSDARSVTPETVAEMISVTPENRINFLQNILKDSIKKSHKKIKDDNKKKLFTPKVLRCKSEIVEQKKDASCWESSEQDENVGENKEASIEHKHFDTSKEERACTPERVNSSRLLLSQFSSVKKSHKKDKHNKILSGFLKRQEYFNKEMDLCQSNANDTFDCKDNIEKISSSFDAENIKDLDSLTVQMDDTPSIKLSPSKRRRSLNMSLEYETNTSYDSELQEIDTSKEEFKIFTPLKRKRSLVGPPVKEYLHFYDLPSGQDEISEEVTANVASSRCLTPIPNFRDNYMKTEENDIIAINHDNDISDENYIEANKSNSSDINGRSTPRDMPTTELYFNVDSIKRSHKKNKRGNSSWKGFDSLKNRSYMEEKEQASMKSIENEASERSHGSNECIAVNDINQSIESDHRVEASSNHVLNNEPADIVNVTTENVPSNVTPPNCLKVKNYMRLLQETSIKRSHKKVRDKKKQEALIDTSELSDDGSIFGDEEKLTCNEDQSI